MSISFLKKGALLSLLLLLMGVQTLCAAETAEIIRELSPQAGVIVIQAGAEYLIDLDAGEGIRTGDLVSVMQSGEKVIHPVTQELLGTLDSVQAVLRVTRVKDGYSHAVLLSGDKDIKKGDAIRSYSGIPATFRDETGRGESLYGELQAGLPELEWRPYAPIQQQGAGAASGEAGVIFLLTEQGLDIRNSSSAQIRFYPLTPSTLAAAAKASSAALPATLPALSAIVKGELSASTTGGIVRMKSSAQDGIFFGPDMPGLVAGVAVGDFDGNGSFEVATAFPRTIRFGTVSNGQYQASTSLEVGSSLRLLTIAAVDLDKDGRDELYLTAAEQDPVGDTEEIASICVEFVEGRMQVRQGSIPYLLGSVLVPGEGRILIGQRPDDPGRTYASPLYRFVKQGGEVVKGEKFQVPTTKATVHGLAVLADRKDQPLYVLLDLNEKLKVYSATGDNIWEGGEVVGGTEAYIVRRSTEERLGDSVYDYLKADLDRTADGLILVPTNEGSTRMFKAREFSKSFMSAFRWDGRSLREEWKTVPQGGSLAGFTYADVDNDGINELVSALIFNHGTMLNPSLTNSNLVIYELP